MKKIVAINASPRTNWNTAQIVKEAVKGAESVGVEVEYIDLYKLEKFSGCMSCFACKLPKNYGKCVYKDALAPVLESIRNADGLIMGTPNYFGDVSAGFRALYERLAFQYLTYKSEQPSCNNHKIPILFVMTSNLPEEAYSQYGYDKKLKNYKNTLDLLVGETKFFICGNTLQVSNYAPFNWTMFDVEAKKKRHEEIFPIEKEKAFNAGKEMAEKL